ncbi:hypothetical protein DM02DRAFT_608983 [Periconia macrospinosa]|uniref:Secreted protein n=1 Tax=Periconia macrospinosa TaxID=97972 RepID=A0A2V1EA84_9PLEO|nr:hypothetical protein DM02DRAFT_608983 [Periconia macrospinosa]
MCGGISWWMCRVTATGLVLGQPSFRLSADGHGIRTFAQRYAAVGHVFAVLRWQRNDDSKCNHGYAGVAHSRMDCAYSHLHSYCNKASAAHKKINGPCHSSRVKKKPSVVWCT